MRKRGTSEWSSSKVDDLDAAQREFRKALELGEYSVAHYHLAGPPLKRAMRDAAIQELEIYLQASPNGDHVQ